MSHRARCVVAYIAAAERCGWLADVPDAGRGHGIEITVIAPDDRPILAFTLEPEADHA